MGGAPAHPGSSRKGAAARGRGAVPPANPDGNLSRPDDVGGHLRDAGDHLRRGSEGGRIAQVGHGDLEQVPLVVHHEALEVVRGLADRPRRKAGATAERARAIVRDAEYGDAGRLVLRDGVCETGRGHPRAETAWAYLRTSPVIAR